MTRRRTTLAVLTLLGTLAVGCAEPPAALEPSVPPEEGARSSAASPAPIRVVTLNAWAIPWVSKDLHDRMRRLGPAVSALDPDVVCLQEMFSVSARATVLSAFGEEYGATGGAPGGLVVLTRLPVLEHAFTPFPTFPNLQLPEQVAGKGLMVVVVKTADGPLRVVTAHLALAFGEGNPRTRQLRFLLDHLDQLDQVDPMPTVLAADLNTPPVWDGTLTDDYLAVLARGWRSTDPPRRLADDTWLPPTPTRVGWPRAADARRVFHPDHVLLRDGGEAALGLLTFAVHLGEPDTAVSDHNLLLADVRVSSLQGDSAKRSSRARRSGNSASSAESAGPAAPRSPSLPIDSSREAADTAPDAP